MVLKVGSESWSTAGDRGTVVTVDGIGRVGLFVCADMYSKRLVDETAAQDGRPSGLLGRLGAGAARTRRRMGEGVDRDRSASAGLQSHRHGRHGLQGIAVGRRRRRNDRVVPQFAELGDRPARLDAAGATGFELARDLMAMWLRCLLAMAGLLAGPPAWAQAPQRVVTVNLCLDQLALRLAAPGQLVGVSYLSHDPRISVLADRARAIPAVRAKVESILELRPDLVIFDRDAHANIKRLVRKAGVPILEVPWAASLEDAEALIARIGAALGRDAEAASDRRRHARAASPARLRGAADGARRHPAGQPRHGGQGQPDGRAAAPGGLSQSRRRARHPGLWPPAARIGAGGPARPAGAGRQCQRPSGARDRVRRPQCAARPGRAHAPAVDPAEILDLRRAGEFRGAASCWPRHGDEPLAAGARAGALRGLARRRSGAVAVAARQRGRLGDRVGAACAARHARPADRRRARPERARCCRAGCAIRWPSRA